MGKLIRNLLFGIVLIITVSMRPAPRAYEGTVKWMTFEEAVAQSEKTKKKIFIDVYTDWCGWCKVMDRNTFSDPIVAKLLNEEFYAVKFNAEQTEDVVFRGHTFKFVPSGRNGYHQLAASLLNNQLSYPTVVFLDEDFGMITPLAGYRKADEFHKYLTWVSDEHYKKGQNGWSEFEKDYKSPYLNN